MVNQNMAARLAEANARYQTAGEGPDGPPPGQYQMQLRSAIFRESSNGKYMIRWTFVILDGAEQGQEVSDMSALESESPVPLRMLKERIRKLGYEPPPEIWDYQELCPLITRNAPFVLASITHSGNYANVSIIEVLQAVGNTVAAAAPAPTPMQAVPPPTPIGIPAPAYQAPANVPSVGDGVKYIDPETGAVVVGVVDEIDAAGQATVGINETDAILVPATALTITAKTAVPAPAAPVPMPAVPTPTPAPTPAPTPGTGIYSEATPVPAQAEELLRDRLIEIATAFGLQVNDIMPVADIVSVLAENEWFLGGDAGVTAAEAAVLTEVGITVTPAPAAAPAPAPAPVPAATPSPRASAKAVKRKPKAKKKTVARKKRG